MNALILRLRNFFDVTAPISENERRRKLLRIMLYFLGSMALLVLFFFVKQSITNQDEIFFGLQALF